MNRCYSAEAIEFAIQRLWHERHRISSEVCLLSSRPKGTTRTPWEGGSLYIKSWRDFCWKPVVRGALEHIWRICSVSIIVRTKYFSTIFVKLYYLHQLHHTIIRVDKNWVKPLDVILWEIFMQTFGLIHIFCWRKKLFGKNLKNDLIVIIDQEDWNRLKKPRKRFKKRSKLETFLGTSLEKEPVSRMKLTALKLVSCLFTTLLLAVTAFGYPASNSEAVSVFVCNISY